MGEDYRGLHCDPGFPAERMWGREGWELIRGLTENVGTVWVREVREKGVKDETQDAATGSAVREECNMSHVSFKIA